MKRYFYTRSEWDFCFVNIPMSNDDDGPFICRFHIVKLCTIKQLCWYVLCIWHMHKPNALRMHRFISEQQPFDFIVDWHILVDQH